MRSDDGVSASFRVGGRDLGERQDLTAVLPHKIDRFTSLLKSEHARRAAVVMKVRRPLLVIHNLARVSAHVDIAALDDESLGRRQFFTSEVGGQFGHPDRLTLLLMFGKGTRRTAELPFLAVNNRDRA